MLAPSQTEFAGIKCDSEHMHKFTKYMFAIASLTTTSIHVGVLMTQNISPPADCLDKFQVITTIDLATQTAHM